MSRRLAGGCSVILVVLATAVATDSAAVVRQPPAWHLPPLDRVLPARVEAIYGAVAPRVNTTVAMETVTFMAPLWRLAGNPDYDRSIDFVAARLAAAGLAHRIESYEHSGQGWEHQRGTLAIEGDPGGPVLSREQDRLALCINSFSTSPGGIVLPLVDVGPGAASDFDGKAVKGAVVLGDAAVGQLWTRAVRERGAAGVVSTQIAAYLRPESTPEVLQWGTIPYDDQRRSFGFKATPRATARLRRALASGEVRVRVDVTTTFHRGSNRTLVAEIPGTTRPQERVVLVAHVQEPGANDNASGSGTLLAAALAIHDAVRQGAMPPPARTVTFLWLDEIRGSEQWIEQDAARAGRVMAMMSLDMTGQDTSKTGGTFLIEKMPDPSAIYPRPSDPHSEWGAGEVDRSWVRGHPLNDLHLAVALRRARDTGWVVRTNPYEGGSDHTVFTRAGVPALLNWHFTDRYYHSNLDTADKTSPATMGHVATAVATTASFVAGADASDAAPLVKLVNEAERTRLATEAENAASEDIVAAWKKWYAEARASVDVIAR
ncbi:MAG TPA: M28 family peptidase [Vicinamibacterales bacterium]|nr:M28 family peptidase [Vicinamibacterales bacterium]